MIPVPFSVCISSFSVDVNLRISVNTMGWASDNFMYVGASFRAEIFCDLYGGMAASYWCSLNGTWVSSFRNHYSPK
jgi:hypothetical protein